MLDDASPLMKESNSKQQCSPLHFSYLFCVPRSTFFRGQPCFCQQTHVGMVSADWKPHIIVKHHNRDFLQTHWLNALAEHLVNGFAKNP